MPFLGGSKKESGRDYTIKWYNCVTKGSTYYFLATNVEKDLAELLRPWLSKAYFVPEEGKSNIEEHIEMVPLFTALIQENIM